MRVRSENENESKIVIRVGFTPKGYENCEL